MGSISIYLAFNIRYFIIASIILFTGISNNSARIVRP